RRQSDTPGKLAKILVEGKYHPAFSRGPCQDVLVPASGRRGANPNYVVPGQFKRGHGVAGEILVSEKAHLTRRSDRPFRISTHRERRQGKPQRRRGRLPDNCAE